ncbi:Peptidase A1 [Macleaya cordata]|uniref:Peptidase A1 n=1 Tax=Macleaya cordata TaxID=56857 RepID=A0A200PXN5_MACCD|nr:Peptidase A1 [Macleaya cordata]
MAAASFRLLHFSSLFLIILISLSSNAQRSDGSDSLILPIIKDGGSHQYITHFHQRTPPVPINLVVDLGGRFLWVDCHSGYVSSTYRPVQCRSIQCSTALATKSESSTFPTPGCSKNSCTLFPENTVAGTISRGELVEDEITVRSTNGSISTADHFLFSCGTTSLLNQLASGVQGMAGLGRNRIGLPSQLSAIFNLHRKFAICLPSSTVSDGVVFFGGGPYMFGPNIDVSKSLIFTPLISKSGTELELISSDEYYIGVKSIKVNGNRLLLNSALLSVDSKTGSGGTKLSTVVPYTTLESSIYNALTEVFVSSSKLYNMTRVEPVAPFGFCFRTESIGWNRNGPVVPNINFVLQSEMVNWRIFGSNLMVPISDQVMCLGLLDGGLNPKASIVIGGYQLENNLLEFDLGTSMLGFSSSLLNKETSCSGFNFDPVPRVDSS